MTSAILAGDELGLVLQGYEAPIVVYVTDIMRQPVDAVTMELRITDRSGTVKYLDAYPVFTLAGTVSVDAASAVVTGTSTKFSTELRVGDTVSIASQTNTVESIASDTEFTLTSVQVATATDVTMTRATRIVKPAGTTGQYYFVFGDRRVPYNIPDQQETNIVDDYIFTWNAQTTLQGIFAAKVQTVKIISAFHYSLVPYLRQDVDKAQKLVCYSPTAPIRVGYTDAMLASWLESGVHYWNMYEPYPMWNVVDQFPVGLYRQGLIDASIVAAVAAQKLFAVDTDIQSYSNLGNSFVMLHQPGLAEHMNAMSQRLDKIIPIAKKKFVRSGSIRIEIGANYRLQTLIAAAPPGAMFRGYAFSS